MVLSNVRIGTRVRGSKVTIEPLCFRQQSMPRNAAPATGAPRRSRERDKKPGG